MKIVINSCYGGFSLSPAALSLYSSKSGQQLDDGYEIERNDHFLVETVEQLGSAADGMFSKLKIVEVPDDVDWYIQDYDGHEWVAEKHRTWE